MSSWYTRDTFRCPACRYDVTQTLRDGFPVCPECGGEVSEATCSRDISAIPPVARQLIYVSWGAPLLAVVAGAISQNPAVFWPLLALSLAPIYAGWWYVERWTDGDGAWLRALAPTAAILVIHGFIIGALVALTFALFAD